MIYRLNAKRIPFKNQKKRNIFLHDVIFVSVNLYFNRNYILNEGRIDLNDL